MSSLSRAAVVLNRPQPVISRHIKALEEQCGCSLFYRTGRGVALTEIGETIVRRVRALVDESTQILLDIKGQAGVPVGGVSVGMLPSLRIAAEFARKAQRLYPKVDLHLTEASGGQLAEQVATGRVDLAFVLREPGAVGPSEEALLRLPLCLAGPADDTLTAKPEVAFSELAGLPLVMAKPPNALRMLVETTARRHDVPLTFSTQIDPLSMQKALVGAGMGWTVTSRMAVRAEVEKGELLAANIADPSDLIRHLPERHSDDASPAYLPVGHD